MRTRFSIETARARASGGEAPSWMRTDSAIWWPIVSTGLRLVIGSWKIIAMRLPRIARISLSSRPRRSRPSKATLPRTVRPRRGGRRRMIDSAVTLLPQPDSPTIPSVSPAPTSNDTPSTARVVPSSVKKEVARSRTARRGVMRAAPNPSPEWERGRGEGPPSPQKARWKGRRRRSVDLSLAVVRAYPSPLPLSLRERDHIGASSHPPREARVEAVAQAVAEEVHGQHDDGERDAGGEDRPRRPRQEQPRLGDHVAPGRNLGRGAGAEKGQRRLDQDRRRADIGRLHDQRRHRRRHDVAQEDLPHRRAAGDRRLDIGRLAHREHDRAHEADDGDRKSVV